MRPLPKVKVTTVRPREDTGPIYILDLKVGQVERIEREVGIALPRWQSAPSWMDILIRVAIEVQGGTHEDYAEMTYREMTRLVRWDTEGDDDEGSDDDDAEDIPPNA